MGDSNPKDKTTFRDAQSLCAKLLNLFEGLAAGNFSLDAIEQRLTKICLDRSRTKSLSIFVTTASGLITSHKKSTSDRAYLDSYYIDKLKATLQEHGAMAQFIHTMETQERILSLSVGQSLKPNTYASFLHEVKEYANVLDEQYQHKQAAC